MGGMIAQTIAYDFPERTRSLISIMSTTWAPHLPPGREQEQHLGYERELCRTSRKSWKNRFYPTALPNQVTAILSAGDRTTQVGTIEAPTLSFTVLTMNYSVLSMEAYRRSYSGAKLKYQEHGPQLTGP